MKHFVTLAALLTSLSAFAQLPYNPDSNNDGLIGAYDLTSLLSVYSNNFSNGVLSEGTSIIQPEIEGYYPDSVGELFYPNAIFNWDGSTSVVVDLTIDEEIYDNPWAPYWHYQVQSNGQEWINGTTITALIPSNSYDIFTVDWGLETFQSLNIDAPGYEENRFMKWVYWNGDWYRNW